MKTIKSFLLPTLIAVLQLVPVGQAPAQTFTSLGDRYSSSDSPAFLGNAVYATLRGWLSSGDVFYGTWGISDPSSGGSVWVVNTDALTDRTHLYSFSSVIGPGYGPRRNADGADPNGGLILLGDTLYGTTNLGGTGGNGTIFKLSTTGTGFTVLQHGGSQAGLILADNTLYGTTVDGGSSGNGTVFSLNTNGTGYTTLHSFAATSQPGQFNAANPNSGGARPTAELILSGNTLYGTASSGGAGGAGTVFAVNRDGTGFRVRHNFPAPGANGQMIDLGILFGTFDRSISTTSHMLGSYGFAINDRGQVAGFCRGISWRKPANRELLRCRVHPVEEGGFDIHLRFHAAAFSHVFGSLPASPPFTRSVRDVTLAHGYLATVI